jgi:hypothetical protein
MLFLRFIMTKLLLVMTAVAAFALIQTVKAERRPTPVESVPDGGSTMPLLGLALLGVAVLRRKLSR